MAQLMPTTVAITVSNNAATPISQSFAARASSGGGIQCIVDGLLDVSAHQGEGQSSKEDHGDNRQ